MGLEDEQDTACRDHGENAKEEKRELMEVDWYRDEQPRAKVRSVIEQSLDADLPVSYDKDTFTAKIDCF